MSETLIVSPGAHFTGEISVPGDKSISHRALLLGALAEGDTVVRGLLDSEDTRATADCLEAMGVFIEPGETVRIHGAGLHGLHAPQETLYAGNSGTTTRLLLGILAGQPFSATITGDESLTTRPMDRVAIPLRQMGAAVEGQGERLTPPITIQGGELHAINYTSPVASAQVKSAILLAGLYADGITSVTEPEKSRDHTERMLRSFGVEVEEHELTVRVRGGQTLRGQEVKVPGDISSAAFFLVAGCIVPGATVTVCNVGINPTRSGLLAVLAQMGETVILSNRRQEGDEPVADLTVHSQVLHGTTISGGLIPRLIDELPVLAVAAAFAEGVTTIKEAAELRVKESDRIATVSQFLRDMGADIEELKDGMVIRGGKTLHGAEIDALGDHRVAMSAAIAALAAGVENRIHGAETIATSFPNFVPLLQKLGAKAVIA
ncbi:MAG: 3-phosphoshikimate 1-carboxyvinyltransferase [Armatimonadota bacterium]